MMTSKVALKIIGYDLVNQKPVFNEGEHKEAYSAVKKDLELLELIRYAREHSTEGKFNLPNGKQYSCDMGYVEEFLSTIEKTASGFDSYEEGFKQLDEYCEYKSKAMDNEIMEMLKENSKENK